MFWDRCDNNNVKFDFSRLNLKRLLSNIIKKTWQQKECLNI